MKGANAWGVLEGCLPLHSLRSDASVAPALAVASCAFSWRQAPCALNTPPQEGVFWKHKLVPGVSLLELFVPPAHPCNNVHI